jgi:signal transduction histidine kinase
MGISKVFNSMLKRDVSAFLDFFNHSKEHYHVMNPRTAFFKEFKSMARGANDMVHTIGNQKNELKELNRTLEERVKNKTIQLQELLDSQQQFVRYAIHETNTPLSVMITNIELYNMKYGRNNYLAKVEASVKQIFNIYDDLSFLVKKDQIVYPKLEIDLSEYLQSRIHFFDEVAQLATLKFEFISQCEKPSKILFNETKLQRIVDNNLTNAIKYTKRNEVIEVILYSDNELIKIIFASHSIPIKDTKKIFEAYYRENRENHYRDSFGLGLNLVKSICDEEAIEISLHSNEDKTEFQYTFKRIRDENITSRR